MAWIDEEDQEVEFPIMHRFQSQEHLIKVASDLQEHICAYRSKTFCDCKYGGGNIGGGSESGSGCPEMHIIVGLLKNLTPKEFECVIKRREQ